MLKARKCFKTFGKICIVTVFVIMICNLFWIFLKLMPSHHKIPADIIILSQPHFYEERQKNISFVAKERNCKRRNNIFFLKSHKTAGSSVQNILFRYGLKHNLLFALPVNKHDFGYPLLFKRSRVFANKDWNKFNIMAQHIRANYSEVRAVMPPDTFFFSIIREPGAHFESCFDFFYDIIPSFQEVSQHRPEEWLKNAERYFVKNIHFAGLTKNPTVFDFGYDYLNDSEAYVQNTIAEISHRYDMVLIADHYDESLVLLSDALCIPIQEFSGLIVNARSQGKVNRSKVDEIRVGARKWNKADAALFDHFNRTLWRRIKAYGLERMGRSIAELRQARANLTELCVQGGKMVKISNLTDRGLQRMLYKPSGVDVASYNLKAGAGNNELCRHLILPEKYFTLEIFNNQLNMMLENQKRLNASREQKYAIDWV